MAKIPSTVENKNQIDELGSILESHSSAAASWPFTATQWGDFTSITLTDGIWDLEGESNFGQGTPSAGPFGMNLAFGLTAGNVEPTNFTYCNGRQEVTIQNQTFESQPIRISKKGFVVSGGPVTVYLKGISQSTTSTTHLGYRLTARKVGNNG